jgi:hypothetical protein
MAQSLKLLGLAQQFVEWCRLVGEVDPRRVTLTVWLNYNAPGLAEAEADAVWELARSLHGHGRAT